jgi:sphinganine-1-phosphate aldolase
MGKLVGLLSHYIDILSDVFATYLKANRSRDFQEKVLPFLPPMIISAFYSLREVADTVRDQFSTLGVQLNASLNGWEAWEILLISCLSTMALYSVLLTLMRLLMPQSRRGLKERIFSTVRSIPPFSSMLAKEKAKLRCSLLASRKEATGPQFLELPSTGFPASEVQEMLTRRSKSDLNVELGDSMLSGALYVDSADHKLLLDKAYTTFSLSNPLHADVWPSVRQMEAEVVSMTAALLGGSPESGVCGAMTSGGTESILSAMKASRDFMIQTRGIEKPEMIMAQSAHAAYWKACEYFNIKPVVVQVDADFRMSAAAVARRMNSSTAVIIASAPGFPHGVVDRVQDIAMLAKSAGVCASRVKPQS